MPNQTFASRLGAVNQVMPQAVSVDTRSPALAPSTQAETAGLSGAALINAVAAGVGSVLDSYKKGKQEGTRTKLREVGNQINLDAATGQLTPQQQGALSGVSVNREGDISYSQQDPNAGALSDIRLQAAKQNLVNSTPVANPAFPSVPQGGIPQVSLPAIPGTSAPRQQGILSGASARPQQVQPELPEPPLNGSDPLQGSSEPSMTDAEIPEGTSTGDPVADAVLTPGSLPEPPEKELLTNDGDTAVYRVAKMPGYLWVQSRMRRPTEPAGKYIRDPSYAAPSAASAKPAPQQFDTASDASQYLKENGLTGSISSTVKSDGTVKFHIGPMKAATSAGDAKLTADDKKVFGLYKQGATANKELETIKYDPTELDALLNSSTSESDILNYLTQATGASSTSSRLYANAALRFLESVARQRSGAAIGVKEWKNYRTQFFPKVGDPQEVVEAQAKARKDFLSATKQVLPKSLIESDEKSSPQAEGKPSLTDEKKAEMDVLMSRYRAGTLDPKTKAKVEVLMKKYGIQ